MEHYSVVYVSIRCCSAVCATVFCFCWATPAPRLEALSHQRLQNKLHTTKRPALAEVAHGDGWSLPPAFAVLGAGGLF